MGLGGTPVDPYSGKAKPGVSSASSGFLPRVENEVVPPGLDELGGIPKNPFFSSSSHILRGNGVLNSCKTPSGVALLQLSIPFFLKNHSPGFSGAVAALSGPRAVAQNGAPRIGPPVMGGKIFLHHTFLCLTFPPGCNNPKHPGVVGLKVGGGSFGNQFKCWGGGGALWRF